MTEETGKNLRYVVLIQDGEKLEFYANCLLNAQDGDSTKRLLDGAVEVVSLYIDEDLRPESRGCWLLQDPVSIPKTQRDGETTFPKARIRSPGLLLCVPLEPVTSRPSVSNRLHTIDENSTLPTRGEVCAEGRKRESPSTSAKNHNLRETQKSTNLDAIFNHCPLELSPPNITIYHPVFAKFMHLMNENSSDIVFTADELGKAYEFIVISTSFYAYENERLRALQNLKIVHDNFWRTATIPLGGSKFAIPDGTTSVVCSKLPNKPQAYSSIEELETESDCDAAHKADACYASVCSRLDYSLIAASSCCPSFLVACEGSHVSVAGAVFSDRFYTQKLTDYMFMGPRLGRQGGERSPLDIAIREAAKLFRALKICLDDLSEFYANLTLHPDVSEVAAKSQFTSTSTSETFRLPRMFPFWKTFAWNGHKYTLSYISRLAAQYDAKMVFRADMARSDNGESETRPVVVKFTPSYCRDAHVLLAEHDPPLAPALYHCEKVADVGDLYVVVMDYVAEENNVDSTVVVQRLRKAIEVLHTHNYVFGDVRQPNFIQTKDGGMIIDLDWVNIEGKARYPADISLNAGIDWHPEVERGGLIKKEHDLYMITMFL